MLFYIFRRIILESIDFITLTDLWLENNNKKSLNPLREENKVPIESFRLFSNLISYALHISQGIDVTLIQWFTGFMFSLLPELLMHIVV